MSETTCEACQGGGYVSLPTPVPYRELRSRVIDLQIEREIDPTAGYLPDPFEKLNKEHGEVYREAMTAFDVAARREISQEDFGLEPLGLATWSVALPEQTGQLEPLTEEETQALLTDRRPDSRPRRTSCYPLNRPSPGSGHSTTGCTSYERQRISPWEIDGTAQISLTIYTPTVNWAGMWVQ